VTVSHRFSGQGGRRPSGISSSSGPPATGSGFRIVLSASRNCFAIARYLGHDRACSGTDGARGASERDGAAPHGHGQVANRPLLHPHGDEHIRHRGRFARDLRDVVTGLGGALPGAGPHGRAFHADGLYWHLPAERMRREFPYCYCDVEITDPDYGKPSRTWATRYSVMMTSDTTAKRFLALSEKGLLSRERLKAAEQAAAARAWTSRRC